uniref:Uncharacterized protein n=1 Tax=Oryza brachyantha TaxID=4533 RepID=J3NDI9_ORYBR
MAMQHAYVNGPGGEEGHLRLDPPAHPPDLLHRSSPWPPQPDILRNRLPAFLAYIHDHRFYPHRGKESKNGDWGREGCGDGQCMPTAGLARKSSARRSRHSRDTGERDLNISPSAVGMTARRTGCAEDGGGGPVRLRGLLAFVRPHLLPSSFLRSPPPPLPHDHRVVHLPAPSASFCVADLLDGRGLYNSEVSIRKELTFESPAAPLFTKSTTSARHRWQGRRALRVFGNRDMLITFDLDEPEGREKELDLDDNEVKEGTADF